MNNLIPKTGDYKKLLTYKKAEIIYDLTYYFCQNYLSKGDRTVDQMIQAARSGKQNIVEGSAASGTSKETEIKLTNVAKASLQELLIDYEDYIRTRNLMLWAKNSVQALKMRELGKTQTSDYFIKIAKTRTPETIANMTICLIHQEDYLLEKQIDKLSKDFLEKGGFKEQMYKARKESRGY
jgi:four helix bundle suffix protein